MGLGIFFVFPSQHAAFSKVCERDNEELAQTSIWQLLAEFPEVPDTSSLSRAWVAGDASKRLSTPSPCLQGYLKDKHNPGPQWGRSHCRLCLQILVYKGSLIWSKDRAAAPNAPESWGWTPSLQHLHSKRCP